MLKSVSKYVRQVRFFLSNVKTVPSVWGTSVPINAAQVARLIA